MRAHVSRPLLAAIASTFLFASTCAQAGIFRAYLALNGNDANPCTLQQPCRLLPAALAAANDGGEIWLLDSANFNTGPVNIDKSITILAVPGVLGSVVALGGNAINIATADVSVTLRNLNILPYPGASSFKGIDMTNGADLTVQNCNIVDFVGGRGLNVATAAQVTVIDSVFRNNNRSAAFDLGATAMISGSHFSGSYVGVYSTANTASLTTSVAVNGSVVSKNSYGIVAETYATNATTRLFVKDSVIESNSVWGSAAYVSGSASGGVSETTVSNSLVVGNSVGLFAGNAGAKFTASGNTVINNTTGLWNASAQFESAGNNTVRNNGGNTSGTILNVGTM
jgi:hypothetical protein